MVRLGARWIHWTYRTLAVLVLVAVAAMWIIRTDESASGPAIVDGRTGTVAFLLPAAVGPDLASSQKFTVTLPGGGSVGISGLRAQLADDAAIRKAGLVPLDQPAILVTGRLNPGAGAASVLRDAHAADPGVRRAALRIPGGPARPPVPGDAQQRERAMRRTIPFIRQMEYADCGAACLAMVLGYFGKRVDLRELRDMTGAGRDGVTALSVVNAARAYGLRVRGVRADLDDLRYLPRGSILHWEFSHFVVFERTTRKGIRVVDPARGRRVVSMDDLRHAYTGVAILCEPSDGFDRDRSRVKGTWRYLRPMLRQSRNMVRVVATSLIIRLAALGLPLLTLLVVDEIVPRDDHHLLVVLAAGVGMVIGYNFLSAFLRANLLLELQTRFDMGLTMGFIDHLVKLPYSFFLRRSSGDLMMRLQSNTAVRDILATSTMSAVLDGAFATLYLALLFVISPVLAVVVLVLAVLEVSVMVLSWRRNQRLMSRSLQAQADAQSYAYELLAGIETLKASGAEHRAVDHWGGLFTDQINIDLTRGRLGAAVSSVMSTLQIASPLVILMVGAFQVLAGHISLGTMLSASALGAGFLQPLGTMISSGLQLQMLGSYMQRINDVLDTPSEQHGENVGPAPQLSGQIRADDVSFSYGPLAPTVVSGVCSGNPARPAHRHRRPVRVREVDPRASAARLVPADVRTYRVRRPGPRRPRRRIGPPSARYRHPAPVRVRFLRPGEHRAHQPGAAARGGRRGSQDRLRPRRHHGDADGLRHRAARRRRLGLRRSASAHRARPRPRPPALHPAARRGDQRAGHRDGAEDLHQPRRDLVDDHRDRAPAEHHPQRRPDPRHGPGQDRRGRDARAVGVAPGSVRRAGPRAIRHRATRHPAERDGGRSPPAQGVPFLSRGLRVSRPERSRPRPGDHHIGSTVRTHRSRTRS